MRISLRLDDDLHRRARREAARRGMTLSSLTEEALRQLLRPRVELPICTAGGGVVPGVDINDSAALLDRMEEDEPGRGA